MNGKFGAAVRAWHPVAIWRRLHGTERTLLVGTSGTIVLNVAQSVLNFGLTFYLTRFLGADGYGAYAYALAWSSLLAVPSVLGLTPLVIRNVAAYRERGEWGLLRGILVRANQAVLISSAVLVAGGVIANLFVNHAKHELLIPVLVALPLVPIIAVTSIRQAAMQGLSRVVLGRMPDSFLAPALFLALIAGFHSLDSVSFSPTWAVVLQVAAFGTALVVGALLLRRVLPHHVTTEPPQHATREWIRSAIPLIVFSGVNALNSQIQVILLGSLRTAAEAGLFSVSVRVAGLVTFLMAAASSPISPMIARLHASGDLPLLRRTIRRAAIGIFLASLPVACGIFVFARQALTLFGGDFEGGVTALVLLAAGQCVFAATGLAGTVLVMTGRESLLVRGVTAGAVANVVLSPILIPLYGLNGAAVSTLVGTVLMNVCLVYFVRRRAGIPSTAFGV